MLDLQERIYNKNAQIEFNRAMASMQSELPVIKKEGEIVVNGQVRSKYAKFEDILTIVRPVMKASGFAMSFKVDTADGKVKVTGTLMHKTGHTENTTMELPVDTSGSKNNVQGLGSSIQYGKRYVLCALLNIATSDDDDGVAGGGKMILVEDVIAHVEFIRNNFDSVGQIKKGLNTENFEMAAMAWCDLDEQEKRILWRAPTKGGILTTIERDMLKSTAFRDACIAIMPGTKTA